MCPWLETNDLKEQGWLYRTKSVCHQDQSWASCLDQSCFDPYLTFYGGYLIGLSIFTFDVVQCDSIVYIIDKKSDFGS